MNLIGWQVVHLQAIGQISHSRTLLAVCARNNYNLMATVNQALSEVVHVHFDTSKVRYEEI